MGFCFFSNVSVGALHALDHHDLERVLILDWDVHHGNGTQHILESRPDALFVSLHQHPLYPGTGWVTERGTGRGEGYTINVPLPAGCADAEYLAVLDRLVLPIADAYRPQLVLVSAGFDSDAADPLGGMGITSAGFGAMCARVRDLADRHADGRLVLALEGGYDLAGLAAGARACVEDLTGARRGAIEPVDLPAAPGARAAIDRAIAAQAEHWSDALRL
jgi:acetoin utilization deacetylase AcuC-like enzyme